MSNVKKFAVEQFGKKWHVMQVGGLGIVQRREGYDTKELAEAAIEKRLGDKNDKKNVG